MENIHNIIFELESALLTPETRSSLEALDIFLADDFIEFGSSGKIYNKIDVLERLPKEMSKIEYTMSNFGVKLLSKDVAQSTFKIKRIINETDKSLSLRCSLWRKNGDGWQIFFHQGTIIHD